MKITHVVDSLEVGGAERLVVDLCDLQIRGGHQVTIYCLFREGALASVARDRGASVHSFPALGLPRLYVALLSRFRADRPDVVHCHNATATKLGAPLARLAHARAVISTRHGHGANVSLTAGVQFWAFARFCDRIVAVSEAARRNLSRNFGACSRRLICIRNGAAPAPAAAVPSDLPAKTGFCAVHVSRLASYKDQRTLLLAARAVTDGVPAFHLWIIGDGPERPSLERMARDLNLGGHVWFFGERQDVGSWLAAADLFVLSSKTEGLPVALLEAMAAGLPAVVTNVGGMPEIIRLSGAGRVVPAGDPQALAREIIDLAGRGGELRALGSAARQCYLNHFTLERMAADYLALYRECGAVPHSQRC